MLDQNAGNKIFERVLHAAVGTPRLRVAADVGKETADSALDEAGRSEHFGRDGNHGEGVGRRVAVGVVGIHVDAVV